MKSSAAITLWRLADDSDNRVSIARAGAIPTLVALLQNSPGDMKWAAAEALGHLAYDSDNRVSIARAGAIATLVALLQDGTPIAQEGAEDALSIFFNPGRQIIR